MGLPSLTICLLYANIYCFVLTKNPPLWQKGDGLYELGASCWLSARAPPLATARRSDLGLVNPAQHRSSDHAKHFRRFANLDVGAGRTRYPVHHHWHRSGDRVDTTSLSLHLRPFERLHSLHTVLNGRAMGLFPTTISGDAVTVTKSRSLQTRKNRLLIFCIKNIILNKLSGKNFEQPTKQAKTFLIVL